MLVWRRAQLLERTDPRNLLALDRAFPGVAQFGLLFSTPVGNQPIRPPTEVPFETLAAQVVDRFMAAVTSMEVGRFVLLRIQPVHPVHIDHDSKEFRDSWHITGLSAMIPPLVAELNCDPASSRLRIIDDPLFGGKPVTSHERQTLAKNSRFYLTLMRKTVWVYRRRVEGEQRSDLNGLRS